MMETKSRFFKEGYPLMLVLVLMMTWTMTVHGGVRGSDFEPRMLQPEWLFSPKEMPLGAVCKAGKIENWMPSSDKACTDSTKINTDTVPQLQILDRDLSWIASRIKRWKEKTEFEGML